MCWDFGKKSHSYALRFLMSIAALFLIILPLTSCETSTPLKSEQLNTSLPANVTNLPVVGQLSDHTVLHVRVTFKLNTDAMQQFQNQKVEPGKPSHLENIAKKIGIDDSTYQHFKDFFSLQGISLNLSKMRTQLSINAQASLFARLLHTQFVLHKYQGRVFYAPDAKKPPMVPQILLKYIAAVTGLDNYSALPVHQSLFNPANFIQTQHTTADCSPEDQTLLPKDVAHAYGFDQLWQDGFHGENMTINLVEIDGSYQSDIQNYLDCIQFKGKLSTVDVDGSPQDALGESTLDIQMVAGLARSANIKVYQTDADDSGNSDAWVNVNDELQTILDDNFNNANAGGTVSISLGIAEGEMSSQDMTAIDQSIRQLTQIEHMTVFVASGDCGAFTDQTYGSLSVSFPASDGWGVAVGGTVLQIDENQNRANEVAWSDNSNTRRCGNSWGTGGGVSKIFASPGWQNQASNRKRQIPDVSAAAYGLAVYYKGQWGAVGGTSAAAPIWATGLALVHQGLIRQHKAFSASPEIFYTIAKRNSRAYYDVTQGNNLYYKASQGWDYTTGLGTPNLSTFYTTMSQL
jgi:kumamolisin